MTESRHKTTLEVRAETRGIKEVGKEMDKAFNPDRLEQLDSVLKGFSGNVEHLTASLKEMAKGLSTVQASERPRDAETGRYIKRQQGGGGGGDGDQGDGQGGGGGGKRGNRTLLAGVGGFAAGRLSAANSYAQGVGGAIASGNGAAETALNGIPFVGGILAGAMGAARRYVHMADALSATQSGNFGSTGRSLGGFQRAGQQLGMDANASSTFMAGIGDSTGLRGDSLSDEIVAGLAAYQRIGGIDAGGLVGSVHAGFNGATDDPMAVVAETVSTAIESGFREGKIGEYVQQIASWTESARREGILLNPSSANAFTRGFAGLGLSSEAAAATGQSSAQNLRSAGSDNSLRSRVVMNVAMGQMGMSYAQARAATEGNMAPEIQQRALEQFWRMSQGDTDLMAQLLVDEGFAPSYSAALQIAESFAGNGDTAASGFTSDAGDASTGFMADRTQGFSSVSGGARYRAGRTNQEIGVGQNRHVSSAVRAVESAEMSMTVSLVTGLATAITKLTELAVMASGFIQRGDWGGLMNAFMTMAGGALQPVGDAMRTSGQETAAEGRERQQRGEAEGGLGGFVDERIGEAQEAAGELMQMIAPGDDGPTAALHLENSASEALKAAGILRRMNGGVAEADASVNYA